MDAVPIDKYFELFKPGAGGEGGFIRISMDFVKTLKDRGATTGNYRFMCTCSMYSCLKFLLWAWLLKLLIMTPLYRWGKGKACGLQACLVI